MATSAGTTRPLPEETGKALEHSLKHLVDHSEANQRDKNSDPEVDAVHSKGAKSRSWISRFFPSEEMLDELFAYEHMGNYVIDRQTGEKIFELMPIYVRVGMHLLFVKGASYMSYSSVEHLLMAQSIRQGKVYDQTGAGVRPHIQAFIDTYQLPLDELLVKDLDQYPTFNSFFSRRLNATARPITSPEDPSIAVSPADCRLTVFQSVDKAKQFWIKGKEFDIPSLLTNDEKTNTDFSAFTSDTGCALAIARLAPQDYHRFHSPVEGTVLSIKDIQGALYTVNPQAINENLNVFTENKRSVMLIEANLGPGRKPVQVAFVAIGAMLVGSIGWSKKPGDKLAKGEELGWFQYGGSTCIVVFPSQSGLVFDQDLVTTSEKGMETIVKVGMEIAKVQA